MIVRFEFVRTLLQGDVCLKAVGVGGDKRKDFFPFGRRRLRANKIDSYDYYNRKCEAKKSCRHAGWILALLISSKIHNYIKPHSGQASASRKSTGPPVYRSYTL